MYDMMAWKLIIFNLADTANFIVNWSDKNIYSKKYRCIFCNLKWLGHNSSSSPYLMIPFLLGDVSIKISPHHKLHPKRNNRRRLDCSTFQSSNKTLRRGAGSFQEWKNCHYGTLVPRLRRRRVNLAIIMLCVRAIWVVGIFVCSSSRVFEYDCINAERLFSPRGTRCSD